MSEEGRVQIVEKRAIISAGTIFSSGAKTVSKGCYTICRGTIALSKKVYNYVDKKTEEKCIKNLKITTEKYNKMLKKQNINFHSVEIEFQKVEEELEENEFSDINKEMEEEIKHRENYLKEREQFEKSKHFKPIVSGKLKNELELLKKIQKEIKIKTPIQNKVSLKEEKNKDLLEFKKRAEFIKFHNKFIYNDFLNIVEKINDKNIINFKKDNIIVKIIFSLSELLKNNKISEIENINIKFISICSNPFFNFHKNKESIQKLYKKLLDEYYNVLNNKKNMNSFKIICNKILNELEKLDREERYNDNIEKIKNSLKDANYERIKVIKKRKYTYIKANKNGMECIVKTINPNIQVDSDSILWINVKNRIGHKISKKERDNECNKMADKLNEFGVNLEFQPIATNEDLEKIKEFLIERNYEVLDDEFGLSLMVNGKELVIDKKDAENILKKIATSEKIESDFLKNFIEKNHERKLLKESE